MYAIKIIPNYLPGTFYAPKPRLMAGEQGPDAPLTFPTREAALAAIAEIETQPSGYGRIPARNVLAYGQAGPDTLKVVRIR